jgi:multimeric flavodoxin WrbA
MNAEGLVNLIIKGFNFMWGILMFEPKARKSGTEWKLERDEFKKRFNQSYMDPWFNNHRDKISELEEIAWKAYLDGRKAPVTQRAGPSYKDPDYDLSVDWVKAKHAVEKAKEEFEDPSGKSRVLLIAASDRNDHTCPGEISKTSRLVKIAQESLVEHGMKVELLDLSQMTSEFGKVIYPCKGCVSTAMPLCHWPCSCYPNHSLHQTNDWMNEIYPMWVRAHGIMIVTPVYWHQAPSALKLMIDRLVCADGGNPDPTTTHGKDPDKAKAIEVKGWDYPRHLQGRVFSVIVHGDTMGVDDLKNAITSWLNEIMLIPSSVYGQIGRYIGYFGTYAESHLELDKDHAMMEEVKLSAEALAMNVFAERSKKLDTQVPNLHDPRPK